MNEIGYTQALKVVAPPLNPVGDKTANAIDESGNTLPKISSSVPLQPDKTNAEGTTTDVNEALESVNSYVQTIQRDLEFTVDEELDKTVIKVVESDSGKLIRQIPEDVFLELARNLMQDGEINLVDALG